MPKSLRCLASKKFNASCKVHDLDYSSGKMTRIEADVRFLNHMKRQCKGSYTHMVAAYVFFSLVRSFGWLSWRKRPENIKTSFSVKAGDFLDEILITVIEIGKYLAFYWGMVFLIKRF